MEPALFLGFFLIMAACFVLRAAARIHKPLVGHDTWSILLIVDEIRKGHGFNGVCRFYLIEGELDYPPVFFYMLSLFPSSWLRRYNWIINPALDSINAAVTFALAYVLTGNLWLALVAGLVYSFTPVVLEESLNLNMRVFGLIFFNLTMAALVLHYQSGSWIYLVPAVACGILVLLSHKFATQVLYPLLILLAVLNWSYTTLLVLIGIGLGAILFSKGFYVKVLLGHIGITRFWMKHQGQYGSRYMPTSSTDSKKDINNRQQANESGFSVRQLWRTTRRVNPFYWLLSLCPFNPFALIVFLLPFIAIQARWEYVLAAWAAFTLISYYAATYLRFLGHYAGRSQFLEYNALPTAILCAALVWETPAYWKLAVAAVLLLLSLIQNVRSWRRVRMYSRSDDQSLLEDIFDYLRKSKKDGVICLPSSHTFAIPYFTGKKVFYTMCARDYEKIAAFFPVLTVPLKTLSKEYGIHFAMVDTTIVPIKELDLSEFKPVIERNNYVLLERSP